MPKPPKYNSAEELEEKIDAYFDHCDEGLPVEKITKKGKVVTVHVQRPYTVEGLAAFLGFKSRQSLLDYKRKDASYMDALTRARLRIHAHRLEAALLGQQDSKTAALDLAVNFGMQPKLSLPEGAQVIIGYTAPPPALEDGQPVKQITQDQKPEQITE